MKDLDNYGLSYSPQEHLSDVLTSAGGDLSKLKTLLQFFEELYHIAEPFTDQNTKKINAPEKKLPMENLSPGLKEKVDAIDISFVGTMKYCEWITEIIDAYKRVKSMLEEQSSNEFGRLK